MKCLLSSLAVVTILGPRAAGQAPPPPVLPAIVYRDHLLTHYAEPTFRHKPYVISIRPLNNGFGRTTVDVTLIPPRNNFESLFVRGRVLALGVNSYQPGLGGADGPTRSTDTVAYLSPDRLCEAKWVLVEPSGQPVPAANRWSPMAWGRVTEPDDTTPGVTEILHTAVAAAGDRDLLVFDLVRTVPVVGRPPAPPRIVVGRVVPADRIETWGGKAKARPAGDLPGPFAEPFQAYAFRGDYHFVTRSGSVYRSPLPAEGRPRGMEVVWDAKVRSPVRFVVSDGNRADTHYLIFYRDKVGWEYFRLGPAGPEPRLLLERVRRADDSPAEEVYELAQALRAEKVIVPRE